ncbi:MAG: 50S ribosomal protein L30 [Prolixibacteraceae bacterium]|nr:50S ribosomal protein L30 [Prolixibacteraceae bacterium]
MMKIRITQFKSKIGASKAQKKIIDALGLHKLNQPKVHESTPEILGMVRKLQHLVKVEEVND